MSSWLHCAICDSEPAADPFPTPEGVVRPTARKRGDEAVADVGQLEASRAVARAAAEDLIWQACAEPMGRTAKSLYLEVIERLVVLAPEQTYAAIQATREGLS